MTSDPDGHGELPKTKLDDGEIVNVDLGDPEKKPGLEQYEAESPFDKRLDRKFDVHILPWLFGIW
jgi:hypothetical protein